jgi:Clp amino terminal domain, pathogenicity island component
LAAAVELAERARGRTDDLVDHFVQAARAEGCSWTEIGRQLGVTKQAAQQRFVTLPVTPGESWPPGLDAGAGAAFASAAGEARALGHHYLGPEHLLLGLLSQPEELAPRALAALGVTPEAVRARVLERLPSSDPRPQGSLGVAPQTKRLLELARTLAKRLGHRCARTEHVLLAAVSPALKSPAGAVLADCGADAARVCDQLASMLEIEVPELAARLRPRRRRLRRRASGSPKSQGVSLVFMLSELLPDSDLGNGLRALGRWNREEFRGVQFARANVFSRVSRQSLTRALDRLRVAAGLDTAEVLRE